MIQRGKLANQSQGNELKKLFNELAKSAGGTCNCFIFPKTFSYG
jgi:hypothetical protein